MPAEYAYSEDDPLQQKYYKGMQRQLNFHNVWSNHQVIVEADPKIVSMSLQPKFTILEHPPLKKRKQFGKVDVSMGAVPKGKLNKLPCVDFYRAHAWYAMHGTRHQERLTRSKSYHIRREDISIKHVSTKKKTADAADAGPSKKDEGEKTRKKLTYDDIRQYYCKFDQDIGFSKSQAFKDCVATDKAHAAMVIDE